MRAPTIGNCLASLLYSNERRAVNGYRNENLFSRLLYVSKHVKLTSDAIEADEDNYKTGK